MSKCSSECFTYLWRMQFKANAKINLGLFIKSKRPDGYHELESIFLPIDWSDEIEISESKTLFFDSSGIAIPDDPKGNLVIQAFELLNYHFNLPAFKIQLKKNVPIGAGLGGGSSDASHTLKALNDAFMLGLSEEELTDFALQLGSDCPFFIRNQPALAKGRGELLDHSIELNLSGYLLIVVPPIHISTARAYSLVHPTDNRPSLKELIKLPISEWQGKLVNDFEEVLCQEEPILAKLRDQLKSSGADFVSMSGSGSAFFAIYSKKPEQFDFPSGYHSFLMQL